MVLWSRSCGGTQEGPLLFPVLPPDFLCNLGPVSLNLSRTLGKWGPPGCANGEKVICACERIPWWWGMLKYPPRRVRLFPISACQIACLRGGELFLQSAFRRLHGIKTPITIGTSIISERIHKPRSGSRETNWRGEGGSCGGGSTGVQGGRDAAVCPPRPGRVTQVVAFMWGAAVPPASSHRLAPAIQVCSCLSAGAGSLPVKPFCR